MLAAGYLLYMYGRIVFGEVSDFFKGLGDHLTDMQPIEILTLVPLATLVVVFGVQPGLLLDLFPGAVAETVQAGTEGTAIAVDPSVWIAVLGLLLLGIVARIVWALAHGRSAGLEPAEGGAH